MKTNAIRQISNKKNLIILFIGIIILLIAVISYIIELHCNDDNIIFLLNNSILHLTIIGIILLVLSVLGIILNMRDNEYLRNLPYSFDYDKEFWTYSIIGREKKKRKNGAVYYKNYLSWKKHIIEEMDLEGVNKDNYYHFLLRIYRNKKCFLQLIISLVIPAEIFFLSFTFNNNFKIENTIGCIISLIFTIVFYMINYMFINEEVLFIKDYIMIIFPESEHMFEKE